MFNALEKIFGAANANRRNPASNRGIHPKTEWLDLIRTTGSTSHSVPPSSVASPPSSALSPQPSALSEGTEVDRCAAHWRRSVPARARGARMVAVGMRLTFGSWDSTASPGRTSPRRLSPVRAGEEQLDPHDRPTGPPWTTPAGLPSGMPRTSRYKKSMPPTSIDRCSYGSIGGKRASMLQCPAIPLSTREGSGDAARRRPASSTAGTRHRDTTDCPPHGGHRCPIRATAIAGDPAHS